MIGPYVGAAHRRDPALSRDVHPGRRPSPECVGQQGADRHVVLAPSVELQDRLRSQQLLGIVADFGSEVQPVVLVDEPR